MREDGLLATDLDEEDIQLENGLRPRRLEEFVGQAALKERLSILIEAASARGETVDHILFSGPPGLGKTSLAAIVAHEMGASFRSTSGPALDRPGDLAAVLTNLEAGDVLFIDEIHRLPRQVEEVLYPAMKTESSTSSSGRDQPPSRSRSPFQSSRSSEQPLESVAWLHHCETASDTSRVWTITAQTTLQQLFEDLLRSSTAT